MPTEASTPRAPTTLGKGRIEAFIASATECSPLPPRCSYLTLQFTHRAHRCSRCFTPGPGKWRMSPAS